MIKKIVSLALAVCLTAAMLLSLLSPIPAAAAARCVNPGGTGGCFASIQAAINASSAGDVVNVAAGTYTEDIALKAGIQVIGAGASSSIIHGTGGSANLRAPVVQAIDPHIGNNTLLQGFTLTGGNIHVTIICFGGGVFIQNGASPTIRGNLITRNRASLGGGIAVFGGSAVIEYNTITDNGSVDAAGIYVDSASPTIIGNQIIGNQATEGAASGGGQGGGLVIINDSSPTVNSNTVSDNVSSCDGGGIVVQAGAEPTLIDNTVQYNRATGEAAEHCGIGGGVKYFVNAGGLLEGNLVINNVAARAGGGIYVEHSSTPTINGNKILDNDGGEYGGGIVSALDSKPAIGNNYVARNKATNFGNGIFVNTSSPEIRNNTIVANRGTGHGDGILIWPDSAAPVIINNIIVNNDYGIVHGTGSFAGVADYNDVYGNTTNYMAISPGDHDISADPLFVDPAGNNYLVEPGSPTIDAGTNTGAPPGDIDGQVRPQDGDGDGHAVADMGAHELPEAILTVSPTQASFRYDPNDPVGNPSPVFEDIITITNMGGGKIILYTVTPPSNPPFPVRILSPLSGSLKPLSTTDFRYTIDVSELMPGAYPATFTISAVYEGGGSVLGSPAAVRIQALIGPRYSAYLPLVVKQ